MILRTGISLVSRTQVSTVKDLTAEATAKDCKVSSRILEAKDMSSRTPSLQTQRRMSPNLSRC